MITKPFNQQSYDRSDDLCRHYVKEFMLTKGFQFIDNPNIYGVDLISPDGSVMLEVEHKGKDWTDYAYPFPTLHFLERKKKYVEQGAWFAQVSRYCDRLALIPNTILKTYMSPEHLIQVANTGVSDGECFYDINLTDVLFFDMLNGYRKDEEVRMKAALIRAWRKI